MTSLNITPETIYDLISGTIILLCAAYLLSKPQPRKIIAYNCILIAWIFFSVVYFGEAISVIYLNETISLFVNLMQFYGSIAFLIAINYTQKETYYSFSLVLLIIFGVVFHWFGFQPGSIVINTEDGFVTFEWTGVFAVLGTMSYLINAIILIYWSGKTRLHAPFEVQREATLFLVASFLFGVGGIVMYPLTFIVPSVIYIVDAFGLTFFLTMTYLAARHPKLFFILTFSLYRIDVRDRQNNSLYRFDWSKITIPNAVFTEYLDEIQRSSDRLMKVGGIFKIHFQGGVLLMHESAHTSTLLVSSKSSEVLLNALESFALDFEHDFSLLLQRGITIQGQYAPAHALLQKHFSIFPSRMTVSKKQRIFIRQLAELVAPEKIKKLKGAFPNSEEFEMMKEEMAKVPKCTPDAFLELYEELRDEEEDLEGSP